MARVRRVWTLAADKKGRWKPVDPLPPKVPGEVVEAIELVVESDPTKLLPAEREHIEDWKTALQTVSHHGFGVFPRVEILRGDATTLGWLECAPGEEWSFRPRRWGTER